MGCHLCRFDALEDSSSSQFIVKNQDIIDHLKRTGGENWRALLMVDLLERVGEFIWRACPLSAEVVAALEETSQKIFPPHVVSTMEDKTFPFDFAYPEFNFHNELRHSLSREYSPCILPRWYFLPPHFHYDWPKGDRDNLGRLHDYIRLYHICNGSESRRVDGSESSWIYNADTEPEHDGDWDGERGLSAFEVLKQTIDPSTGLPIHMKSWSMRMRWFDFVRDYGEAEKKYALRQGENVGTPI
ncbi:hypothetical protein BJ165DRAFT_644160 [Panaeolus papilionaceus]|nr:hypothetical protein BJ165DRAFT_644160 [Panaeolus papilionaceus]